VRRLLDGHRGRAHRVAFPFLYESAILKWIAGHTISATKLCMSERLDGPRRALNARFGPGPGAQRVQAKLVHADWSEPNRLTKCPMYLGPLDFAVVG